MILTLAERRSHVARLASPVLGGEPRYTGRELGNIRRTLGLSLDDVGRMIGLSGSMISYVELDDHWRTITPPTQESYRMRVQGALRRYVIEHRGILHR